jgi:hypothetical protein
MALAALGLTATALLAGGLLVVTSVGCLRSGRLRVVRLATSAH